MPPARPGPLAALLTGLGLSTIAAAGCLLASGMHDVGRQARTDAPSGPAISLAAADTSHRTLRATAEPRRVARREPQATRRVAESRKPRARGTQPRNRASVTGVLRSQPASAVAPASAPATTAPAAGDRMTAPVATSAARRVSLRLDEFELEPATPEAVGRLRMRLAVDEDGDGASTAPHLPSIVDVVLAVPEVPAETSIRVSVELQRPSDAPADLHVQVAFTADEAVQATVADAAAPTDVTSNTLEVRAPLDRPTTAFTQRVPTGDEPSATAPTTDVHVPVPVPSEQAPEAGAAPVTIPIIAPAAVTPPPGSSTVAGQPGVGLG